MTSNMFNTLLCRNTSQLCLDCYILGYCASFLLSWNHFLTAGDFKLSLRKEQINAWFQYVTHHSYVHGWFFWETTQFIYFTTFTIILVLIQFLLLPKGIEHILLYFINSVHIHTHTVFIQWTKVVRHWIISFLSMAFFEWVGEPACICVCICMLGGAYYPPVGLSVVFSKQGIKICQGLLITMQWVDSCERYI